MTALLQIAARSAWNRRGTLALGWSMGLGTLFGVRLPARGAESRATTIEVIVANQMGMKVVAISVISDLGVEGKIVKISHEDVIDAASTAEPRMTRIIMQLFREL